MEKEIKVLQEQLDRLSKLSEKATTDKEHSVSWDEFINLTNAMCNVVNTIRETKTQSDKKYSHPSCGGGGGFPTYNHGESFATYPPQYCDPSKGNPDLIITGQGDFK